MLVPSTVPGTRSESGSTLIEVLVAVVIMGVAFVVIVGGIGTAIIGSDLQKDQAGADVALRTAGENLVYACPPSAPANYQAQLAPVTGFTLTVAEVSYWNPDTNSFELDLTCQDTGLHLVKLSATPTSGRAPEPVTLEIVKRRP